VRLLLCIILTVKYFVYHISIRLLFYHIDCEVFSLSYFSEVAFEYHIDSEVYFLYHIELSLLLCIILSVRLLCLSY